MSTASAPTLAVAGPTLSAMSSTTEHPASVRLATPATLPPAAKVQNVLF